MRADEISARSGEVLDPLEPRGQQLDRITSTERCFIVTER
jgi:hypothetical protein